MPFVRSFTGYSPPPRYDDEPFTGVDIQEAANPSGAWTTIDSKTLSPVDSDPAVPASRNFTTTAAVLSDGWYRLIWEDGTGGTFTTDAVYFSTADTEFITVSEVARVLGMSEFPEADVDRVRAAIDVALGWARTFLRDPHLGETGSQTYVFYDTRGDVQLPHTRTPEEVRVVAYRGGDERVLDPDDWYYDGNSIHFVGPGDLGLPDDEDLSNAFWHRVEVDVTMPDESMSVRRYGVALAAAAVFSRGTRVGSGVKSESLGDYSYTLAEADASGDPFFAEAKSVLRPYRRRGPLIVP